MAAPPSTTTQPAMMRLFRRDSVAAHANGIVHDITATAHRLGDWLASPQGRGILKCTIAYTLASLATFASPLSAFLGKPDGKHVVATITVYFHASRSAGSMIEAILIAVVAIAYAEIVSILSMVTSVLVGSGLGLVTLAHVLVVTVFVGGGFGFMAWVKQRMGNPLVNVASTLASLAIIAVVTKENAVVSNVFSNQKIAQVLKMLVMGITCASAVNLLLWRVSARAQLRKSLTTASISLGNMVSIVTASFLKGIDDEAASAELSAALTTYNAVYPQLMKNLREAKFEHYFLGREKLYALERSTAIAIGTLAQSVGGLRSAAKSQLALLRETTDQTSMQASEVEPMTRKQAGKAPLGGPSDAFNLFVAMITPHMETLTKYLARVLCEPPFGSAPEYAIILNDDLRQELAHSLGAYNAARAEALEELYQLIEQGRETSKITQAEMEEIAAACGHFSFSLQSLGEEMQKYLDIVDDLKYVSERKQRTWRYLLWWRKKSSRGMSTMPYETPETEVLVKPIKKSAAPKGIPDSMVRRRDTYSWDAAPDASKVMATISRYVLRMLRKMARDDIRFGLKVGIGASMWAMLAFMEETREWYTYYRGEWGLLSFMIVCSMTVGASNTTGWARFVGTFLGAVFSIVNWTLSRGNAFALIVLGSLVSFFNFYLIVACGRAPLGRMTLLAYNVSTLYAYSLSQKVDDDDSDEGGIHPIIMDIVKHRAISVTAGILWGLIVCRLIWPISARRKFKEGASVLYLQMGLIWKRGPLAILLRGDRSQNYLKSGEQASMQRYADNLETLRQAAASEFELRGPFPFETYGRIMKSTNRILDGFYSMSLVTQLKGNLTPGERALLQYTAPERAVLCDRICHVFQVLASSMMLEYPLTDAVPNISSTRDRLLSKIFQFRTAYSEDADEDDDVGDNHRPVFDQRRPSSLGSIGRRTSLNDISEYIGSDLGNVTIEEKDYALLYAYALVTGQVAEELKVAEKEIEGLFGVLSEESLLLQ